MFPCDYCEKAFQTKNAYSNHVNMHVTIMSKCIRASLSLSPFCNKHLSTVSYLKAMWRKNTQALFERPLISGSTWSPSWQSKLQFSCDICLKSFSNKKSLQNHLGIHKGKTTCQICNTVFSTTSNLNFHMRKIHNLSELE